MVLGPDRKGIKLTYTTDTRPTESILRNARESDLFICEGMYGEDDKADKAKGYKHMTFREAAGCPGKRNVADTLQSVPDPSGRVYGNGKRNFSAGLSGEGWKKCGTEF